ncbi:hypothetical protein M0R72_11125 [Candidatus Pacearchaeota archaeon]|jgi:hypothetical protein|nr:hypothetical protein [Candidatus Pacearchaeota archaeon]
MATIADWKARWAANEKACIARMQAYRRMTREQREAAVAHLMDMQPGRVRVFRTQEILEAHIELGMVR